MKSLTDTPPLDQAITDKESFNIIVLYDDAPAGKRAHETCNFLRANFANNFVHYEMWNFGVLRITQVNEQALQNATEADLVIIAISQEKSFEPYIREWFNQWVEAKSPEKKGALIAICPSHSNTPKSYLTYLQEIAFRADFQFFTQPNQ